MSGPRFECIQGDCLDAMRAMPAESVDAVVTDPPYGLEFMGKDWDRGVPGEAYWREVLRVMKPGAHLLSFGGSRTYHRMACAIEDAGFEIRDQLMWLYGSGFPKSLNVSKAIDRAAGFEPQVIGQRRRAGGPAGMTVDKGWNSGPMAEDDCMENITLPVTDQARAWEGWGTALKPAHEPILMARKPFSGTVAENVAQFGTSALNIDACRIGTGDDKADGGNADQSKKIESMATDFRLKTSVPTDRSIGRWPANVLHDGSEEVLVAFPDAPGQQGDLAGHSRDRVSLGIYGDMKAARDHLARLDEGSAARFFYCAKASRAERDAGLEREALKLFAMSTGARSALAKGSPAAEYQRQTMNSITKVRNHHPTVKPIELMRYLCRLVTPQGGVLLDPFMGSGTTGCAAVLEEFNFIGMDKEAEFVDLSRRRIAYWHTQRHTQVALAI